jgi:hypothetical protein
MMTTLEILQTEKRPTDTEVAGYVAEMTAELAAMARKLGAQELAAMLEKAQAEAERVTRVRSAATSH